jgi:2-polyprenyl-3-methyl-5-hydroxy-6-metoxy-1,4-benzoquinol methylase
MEDTPFAVNGILRRRCIIRRHKLWECARSAAAILPGKETRKDSQESSSPVRILDFGGAATLPVFFFAAQGCEVECLDIDEVLAEWTNEVGERHGWQIHASAVNLVETSAPAHWAAFDAVVSASVLEHIPKASQTAVVRRLGALLRPGGVMAISFDYGEDAPQAGAIRDALEVKRLVTTSGLSYPPAGNTARHESQEFLDTGERFALDRRHPRNRFTFGSLFLRKP